MKKLIIFLFIIQNSLPICSQWQVKHVDVASSNTINVIKFYNQENGLAMGMNGLILKSSDYGESWVNIESGISGSIRDFDYINLDTLLAVSVDFIGGIFTRRIFKSIDKGFNWTEKFNDEGDFNSIVTINTNEIIASGSNRIYKTNDSGESWNLVFDMTNEGFKFGEVRKLEMIDETFGYAVGSGLSSIDNLNYFGFLLITENGGTSWKIINEFDGWLKEIDFLNSEIGYISDGLSTLKTNDGGITWDTLTNIEGVVDFSLPNTSKIITVNRPEAYTGDALSTVFAISESNDSGLNWNGEYKNGAHLESIYFVTDSIGYVAGDYSLIMKTEYCGGEIIGDYPWHLFTTSTNNVNISNIKIYPNPTTEQIFLDEIESFFNWDYRILSKNGSEIIKGKIISSDINISNLPSGFYYIIIERGNYKHVGKLIKI